MDVIKVKIDGMMCSMCEAHICDTIRKAVPGALKVSASRRRGEAVFLTKTPIDERALEDAIRNTGYTFVSLSSEPYKKKSLFNF